MLTGIDACGVSENDANEETGISHYDAGTLIRQNPRQGGLKKALLLPRENGFACLTRTSLYP